MLIKIQLAVLLLVSLAQTQEVRIEIFGLFQPRQLTVKALPGNAVVLTADENSFVLESSSGKDVAEIQVLHDAVVLQVGSQNVRAGAVRAASRRGGLVDFELSVPQKIHRHYRGVLEIATVAGVLSPVISMDLETAVASAVQAESLPGTPLEALKAQAVATRSYFLAAKGRHRDFDFCDTTHCQFLREPPPRKAPAFLAAEATQGLVLTYREQAFAAMFTRSCGGVTHTPQEVGIPPANYPYFPVPCDFCLRQPVRWQRSLTKGDADLLSQGGEAARLEIGRRLGWDAVPSNTFTIRMERDQTVLEGTGEGHGIGLCQRGARGMAEKGANFRKILAHYYPNTQILPWARPE